MSHVIEEGLQKGDLDHLVLPLLTIDQYSSKISDDLCVVVGFYVFEEDAAHDLSNFIERSPYMVRDTDVSPAPTKDGYYVTFIEINRTPDFVKALLEILQEVSKLTNVNNWQFQSPEPNNEDIKELNKETLEKWLDLEIREPKKKEIKETLQFFAESLLSDVVVEQDVLRLIRGQTVNQYQIVSISNNMPEGRINLGEAVASKCLVLERFLCGPYSVAVLDDDLVIEHNSTYLILRELD